MTALSPVRRREILQSLRQGTVPDGNLDVLAVGIDRFATTIDEDLDAVASGGAIFKAVRGEYGSGKTFFSRWVEQRAMQRGLAVAEVQISELETPLHKLETVYRRTIEELRTSAFAKSAFRNVIDAWLYGIEEDAATAAGTDEATAEQIAALLEQRLASVATATPVYPMVLRAYRDAVDRDDAATADALIAWLGGQPHVGAAAKRVAGVRQDVDHFLAMGFLQGLLAVLKGARHPGLVLVIDEVETLQRMRSDSRAKALNALRQWIDELDSGRYPGLYLIITGTPAFYDGRLGVQALPPLAQRLQTDFGTDARFDNPRAPQIRLTGFDLDRLVEVGIRVRDVYADGSSESDRIRTLVDDAYLRDLADAVAGELGGKVGVSPRIFLKKLVADVLDRVDQFADFDPRQHYSLTIADSEKAEIVQATSADEVEL
ncbi:MULTISPECIES: BREX system ATP-binding protein BrxD [Rhodococcus]|uniref:BREX system ATP-binding protein BrxD n=1 Tax=Rhodococcus TaxID=1827 RepID=UPI001878EFCC|nr:MULTISPECIES: BREX system ATP-binding protein BrxD [Rhodococcus]MBJ7480054.1 BREX system ATP-binding protein BrxD [Rhodococcus sp. (in: high G+C Gram-positive bacteria)]QOS62480.1 BREX system ATP-binding protein BrxD [Rhodococcus qingshengii]WEX04281.1 BREX system ATP-binding protein BrxD [Rhodococcus sp. RCBS9]